MGQKPKKQPKADKAKPKTAAGRKSSGSTATKSAGTIRSREKQSRVEYIVVNIIALFVFLAFGYVAIMSFLQTSVIDPNSYSSEVVLYINDNLALNLLFTALFFFIAFMFRKKYNFFAKINIKFFEIGIAVWAALLGLFWIFAVTSVPAADSQNIFETATKAAKGVYTPFYDGAKFYNKDFYKGYSYFNFYPFQLGFVLISEIIYRIFGTESSMPTQVINVLCVASSYFALARMSRLIFKRKSIEFFVIMLLAVCLQPILLCTFVYGNIIGMSAAIWASLALIKYFQTGKYVWMIPSGLLLVLATLAKYNNMIYLAAFVIVLIVHTIKKKKWQSVAFALALCIAAVGASNLVILSYENRADIGLADGLSQVEYLDMGLTESYMAPGWYTRTGLDIYINNDLDNKAADAEAWEDIDTKTDKFGEDLGYAFDFFSKKILSQWNEPEFESIWVSKVKSHTVPVDGGLGKAVYEGSLGQLLALHFNLYMQIVYLLFAVGIYLMFINKKTNIETMLLPLVALGGFGYHLLFEGKSQYVLTYIPLLIPVAAYALNAILEGKYTNVKKFFAFVNKKVDLKKKKQNSK